VRLRALITRRLLLLARASCVRSILLKGGKRVKRTGRYPDTSKTWICLAPIPKEMAYFTPIPAKKKANFPDTSKKEGEIPRYQQKRRRNSPIPAKKKAKFPDTSKKEGEKPFSPRFLVKSAAEGKPSRDNRDSGPTSTQLTQGLRPPNLADLLQDRGANRVVTVKTWAPLLLV
jgi:hypothetical protein